MNDLYMVAADAPARLDRDLFEWGNQGWVSLLEPVWTLVVTGEKEGIGVPGVHWCRIGHSAYEFPTGLPIGEYLIVPALKGADDE